MAVSKTAGTFPVGDAAPGVVPVCHHVLSLIFRDLETDFSSIILVVFCYFVNGNSRLRRYNNCVKRRKKKPEERPVFDGIRKPTAPPTQRFGGSRPETKVHPTGRTAKHKQGPDEEE